MLLKEDEDTAERLQRTEFAQPAIFATEYAMTCLLRSWGIEPFACLGHSVGEYAAALCAGVMSLEDAARLIAVRASLMQALPEGAMLAVVSSPAEIRHLLPASVSIAAVNAPNLCAVSGPSNDIAGVEAALKRTNIRSRRLHTSHAFHSAMMDPILKDFQSVAGKVAFNEPRILLASNVTGALATTGQIRSAAYWAEHIRKPVLFSDGLATLLEQGAEAAIEVGPGRSLLELARQCGANRQGIRLVNSMPDPRSGSSGQSVFLKCVARLWADGVPVDLASNVKGRRPTVPLPGYAFERKDCGLGEYPTAGTGVRKAGGKLPIADWLYQPSWKRRQRPSAQKTCQSQCGAAVIFSGYDPFSRYVEESLRTQGLDLVSVRAGTEFGRVSGNVYQLNPNLDQDFDLLVSELTRDYGQITRVVHLWTATAQPAAPGHVFDQTLGLFTLLRCAAALRKAKQPVQFDIVTNGVHQIVGEEKLVAGNAALGAFQKVVPQEQPGVRCRLIDLCVEELAINPCLTAERVAHEILATAADSEVGLRANHRWIRCFERIDSSIAPFTSDASIRPGGAYLIAGGLGDLGLSFADWLSRDFNAQLVLVSRGEIPEPGEWQQYKNNPAIGEELRNRFALLDTINSRSPKLKVVQADLSNPHDLRQVVDACAGIRLDGIFYMAGRMALSPTLGPSLDEAEYHKHLDSKAVGLKNFAKAFGGMELDFRVLFSSISTILGGLGHCGYAAANLVANAVASDARRHGSWTTIDWDLWRSNKVVTSGAHRTATQTAIVPEEGFVAFQTALAVAAGTEVVVSTRSLENRIVEWIRPVVSGSGEATAPSPARSRDLSPGSDWEGEIEKRLGGIWLEALGIETISRHDDFFDAGGHSLLAVEVTAAMRDEFGVEIPIEEFFKRGSISSIAERITQMLREQPERARGQARDYVPVDAKMR